MSQPASTDQFRWYAVQTLSNQEAKVKRYVDKFIVVEEMEDYIKEVLMPTEQVTEVKSGKKRVITRKFYPGYVFVHMRLFDKDHKVLQKPWYFVRGIEGVIGFVGGDNPVALKKDEIERIQKQIEDSKGKEKPSVEYTVGEEVKITDGPFMNLTGRIDEVYPDRGRLKISVSIFGRFTSMDLEYWQVVRNEE